MMKKYVFLLLILLSYLDTRAQEEQVLRLNAEQIEALFLKNNLELIASRFNIDIADAAILQARLWDNPSLSIGDVNLWSTRSQREGEKEVIPPLFGSFARNTEFSIELSQLVQTANKRGKLINREKVSKEIATQEFEDVLRSLKTELRKSIFEIQYLQSYLNILKNQSSSMEQVINSYKKSVEQGNIAKSELLRLQSSFLELESEINDTYTDLNDEQRTLKVLLNADSLIRIEIDESPLSTRNPEDLSFVHLLEIANGSRPDMKAYKLQTQFHEKSLAYEKSLRIPDLTFSASYDRHGGVWGNFIGFGVSMDLPFFNRNQGNVKAARISRDQSQYLVQQQQNVIEHEVAAAYRNYAFAYKFYEKLNGGSLLPELDNLLGMYYKNLLSRNVSMLEYIDFLDAYKTNKQTMLTAKKKIYTLFEELQYTIGTEIK